jgi:hypothetical protein
LTLQFAKAPTATYAAVGGLDFGTVMENLGRLPSLEISADKSAAVDLSSLMDMSSLTADNPALLAVVALAVVGVGAAATASGGSGGGSSSSVSGTSSSSNTTTTNKPPAKKIDVSIPYDAAARMAYEAWCQEKGETFMADGYALFQELYTAKAVAEATVKKRARDFAMFTNKA